LIIRFKIYKNQYFNIGVCLNEDYVGGDFVLYEPEYTILPKKTGEIYTFKHSYDHEVLEVTEGHRWSLIGFYFYEHLDFKKEIL
jgi:predicted 2-oxoglutarate/Fe(II)-dependent dioxygenase YbiX